MRVRSLTSILAVSAAAFAVGAMAQPSIPRIVVLPDQDFVWTWRDGGADERRATHFSIEGREQQFFCRLSGRFRINSDMTEFYQLRAFEQSLIGNLYFIQDATNAMNSFEFSNDLDWALLECTIPDYTESEEKTQERVDKALEKALRDRERRRAREDR